MYPTDQIRTAQHNRLMAELKSLFVIGEVNSNLKKLLLDRLHLLGRRLLRHAIVNEIPESTANYFSTAKIVIYTCIFGTVDEIHEPIFVPDNCDFYIVTDQDLPTASSWIKKKVDFSVFPGAVDPVTKNRFVKMHPHLIFPEYDYSIYLDGTIQARTDLTEWIQEMPVVGLKMFNHPVRHCTYTEIEACIKAGKGSKSDLLRYAAFLRSQGMPENYGLVEGGVIVRQSHNPVCVSLMTQWWQEFLQQSRRDQISLPYILWKNQIQVEQIAKLGHNLRLHPAIRKYSHRPHYARSLRKA